MRRTLAIGSPLHDSSIIAPSLGSTDCYNKGTASGFRQFLVKGYRVRALEVMVLSEWSVFGENELDPEELQRNLSNRKEMNANNSRAAS